MGVFLNYVYAIQKNSYFRVISLNNVHANQKFSVWGDEKCGEESV